MDANVKVLDNEINSSRYTSNTEKHLVLLSSKDNRKSSQGIINSIQETLY
jgi:hypothetical protein